MVELMLLVDIFKGWHYGIVEIYLLIWFYAAVAIASHAGDRGSIPGRYRPKSLKQGVTAPLPNALQQMWVSRVLEDDYYKWMPLSTASVTR